MSFKSLLDGDHDVYATGSSTGSDPSNTVSITVDARPVITFPQTGASVTENPFEVSGTSGDIGQQVFVYEDLGDGNQETLGSAIVEEDGIWLTIVDRSDGDHTLFANNQFTYQYPPRFSSPSDTVILSVDANTPSLTITF